MLSGVGGINSMAAFGQRPMQRPNVEEKFSEMDVNGDGALNTDELQVMADKISEISGEDTSVEDLLGKLDSDSNGSLQMSELPQMNGNPFGGHPPFDQQGASPMNTNSLDSLFEYLSFEDDQEKSSSTMEVSA